MFVNEAAAILAIRTLICYIGDDPDRPGLEETPKRFLAAWKKDWGTGYQEADSTVLVKLFAEKGFLPDQMVLVKDIQFYSTCEHHMAPFFGTCDIAYIPTEKGVVGLSKLARIVDHFSRRLQVQERLTQRICYFIGEHISPDVAVTMRAEHMCMVSRGVKQPNAKTVTSSLQGEFLTDASTRSEFFSLTRRP